MRRGFIKKQIDRNSQKTKCRAVVAFLGVATGTGAVSAFATATNTNRTSYNDTAVISGSKIQILHLDLAVYQDGAAVASDGFVDWFIWKSPGGQSITGLPSASPPLGSVPFIFQTGRAAIPAFSATGLPCIYHISGTLKVPPRFQTMAIGDILNIGFFGTTGAGATWSVSGTITYMYKV